MSNNTQEFSSTRRWIVFSAVLFVCLASYFNFFKGAPIFPAIGGEGIFAGQNLGLLMSAGGIAGLILAYPFAFVMRKVGSKITLIIIGSCTVIGGLIGIFAVNFWMMLVGRIIESMSPGWLALAAPTIASEVIPKKKLGLALGVAGVMFPVATVIANSTIPSIYLAVGESWQMVWVVALVVEVAAIVYAVLVFKQPPAMTDDDLSAIGEQPDGTEETESKSKIRPDFLTVGLLAVTFFLWGCWWTGAFNSGFYNTFLVENHGLDIVAAGLMVAIPNTVNIFSGPLIGFVVDKLGTRKWVIAGAWVVAIVLSTFMWGGNMALVWVNVIIIGIVAGVFPTATNNLAVIAARDQKNVSLVMATVAVGSSVGVIVGPALYPPILALVGSYELASFFYLVPICALALVVSIVMRDQKRVKK